MKIRPYEPHGGDYQILTDFWTQKGLPPVPPSFLPPTGLVVHQGRNLLCIGFLVKSDTAVACIGSVAANPKIPARLRSEALDFLLFSLSELAQKSGFKMVSVATNVPALQRRYERLGFKPTDTNVICYAAEVL